MFVIILMKWLAFATMSLEFRVCFEKLAKLSKFALVNWICVL